MSPIECFVGPYSVRQLLGRGGNACVFRAIDVRDGREVALKISPASKRSEARMRREWEVLRELDYPFIVRVFDWGREGDWVYMAMALIDGAPLDRAPSGPLVAALRDAMEYLRSKGVEHGDVRPSNVIVNSSGLPVLVDFGAARRC